MSPTKAPLDPAAGSVPVPDGGEHSPRGPSIRHDLNSAHVKKEDIDRTSSPGMGTSNAAKDNSTPNWQNQDAILDAASHGQAAHETTADVDALKAQQHPESQGGRQSGPTGLLSGERNMEEEGTSKHDQLQNDLLKGKVSRDGEGSAGLPFDAGN